MRLHIYSTERTNEVIRRIRLWSDTARLKTSLGGFVVRVGVAKGNKTFWLGQWSQFTQTLNEAEYIDITGIPDLNWPLAVGEVCVVEILSQGPVAQNSTGMVVEWKFARYGAVGDEQVAERLDGSYPGSRTVRPLFSLGRHVPDPVVRGAIEPIEETLNTSGVTEWVLSTPLPDTNETEEIVFSEIFEYGAVVVMGAPTAQTLLATAPTIEVPDPSVPYRLHISAGAAVTGDGGGVGFGEFYVLDSISGTQIVPAPATLGQGIKVGSGAVNDFSSGTAINVGWPVPSGQATVVPVLYGLTTTGFIEFHDPWISARLLRDPYLV